LASCTQLLSLHDALPIYLFRKLGAQDIAGYKRAGSGTGVPPVRTGDETHGQDARATNEPMPRVLLLIDEFQELFVEDDRVSQGADRKSTRLNSSHEWQSY